ncbi:MAG: alpha/beta fold hydrolase [Steroidobacter sp.]
MKSRLIIFSHGKDSEPWGSKILALAACARELGYQAESVDYRGIDDPRERVSKLMEFAKPLDAEPVLVGSSLGGHVATAASIELRASGLFLMAPAFYMPGYEQYTPKPASCPLSIIHGWNDDIVPIDNSIRYAREHFATLHAINADHRMTAQIDMIVACFKLFLNKLT